MGQEDNLMLTQQERDRLHVIRTVMEGRITPLQAAGQLDLCLRQVRRLVRRVTAGGDAAIVHGLRRRAGNRRASVELRRKVLARYQGHYADFGPTLATEKLCEEGLVVSAETLRPWLTAEGLWRVRREGTRHRARRERRACVGELVQMDASHHAWLEDRYRGPVVLLVMVDDASSHVYARFCDAEGTMPYMELLWRYILRYGRPLGLYVDRHTIFRAVDRWGDPTLTQLGRACKEANITLHYAGSPQAKGRVERFFGTAQDRWVRELRLAGAKAIAQANALLEARLLPEFNVRWTVAPASTHDAHRPWRRGLGTPRLESVRSLREERSIGNDYTFHYDGRIYQIPPPARPGMRGGRVTVERRLDGTLWFGFRGQTLHPRELPTTPTRHQPSVSRAGPPLVALKGHGVDRDRREPFLPGGQPAGGWLLAAGSQPPLAQSNPAGSDPPGRDHHAPQTLAVTPPSSGTRLQQGANPPVHRAGGPAAADAAGIEKLTLSCELLGRFLPPAPAPPPGLATLTLQGQPGRNKLPSALDFDVP